MSTSTMTHARTQALDTHDHDHISSMRLLNFILVALLILTALTVAASRIHFGEGLNLWIAIGIAVIKASLVCAFFMHLLHDKAMNSIVLFFCILTIGLFLLFTLIDLSSRGMVDPIRDGPIQAPMIAGNAREAAIAEGTLIPEELSEGAAGEHTAPPNH